MDERYQKGGPLPNSMGAQADLYAEVRELRLGMQKMVDEVKERETEIYNVILAALKESADTGAAGERYRVQMVSKTRLNAKDWNTTFEFIRTNNLFELLQRRLNDKAVRDLFDQYGQYPPGVEAVEVETLSFNKI